MDTIEMAGHLIRRLHQQSTQVFQAQTQAAGCLTDWSKRVLCSASSAHGIAGRAN
jgi:hypothetical protein